MDLAALGALLALAVINVVVPGPCAVLVSSTRLARGATATERTITGIAAGHFVWGTAAAAGLVVALQQAPNWFLVVKLAGALYVFWMGSELLCAPDASRPDSAPNGGLARFDATGRGAFAKGLLTAIANPSVALFYLAVVPAVSGERPTPVEHAAVVLLHAALCVGWYEMLGRMIGRSCGAGSDPIVSRRLLHVCALMLMGFGLGLVASA